MKISEANLKPGDKFSVEFTVITVCKHDGFVSAQPDGGRKGSNGFYKETDVTVTYRKPEPLKVGDKVYFVSKDGTPRTLIYIDGEWGVIKYERDHSDGRPSIQSFKLSDLIKAED